MELRKFDSQTDAALALTLPFSYYSTLIHLDFFAKIKEINNELVPCWESIEPPGMFPIFTPRKIENRINTTIWRATENEIKQLQQEKITIKSQEIAEKEYFYLPEAFLKSTGKFGTRLRHFLKTTSPEVSHSYPVQKIREFYEEWKLRKKPIDTPSWQETESFFFYCLENLDRYNIRQVYVEIKGKLEGFAWGILHSPSQWVGLHLKTNITYPGLGRFLHRQRAQLFPDAKLISLGPEVDQAIQRNKEELGPTEIRKYYYVRTGAARG